MTLSDRIIRLKKPLKNVSIAYYGEPDISVDQASAISTQSSAEGYASAESFYKDQILQLQSQVAEKQSAFLSQLETQFKDYIDTVNHDLPSLVLAISERVLAGTKINKEIVERIIIELVSEFNDSSNEELTVTLCESDLKLLKAAETEPTEELIPDDKGEEDFSTALAGIFDSFDSSNDSEFVLNGHENIKFRIDNDLKPGDCQVKSRFGLLDGRIATKLKRIQLELQAS